MAELIEEILLASRPSTRSVSTCRRSAPRRPPAAVDGEGRLLARLLRNLLENAARHAPGSSVEVSLAVEGGRALLRVSDRGPGVQEDERERIFEPFYRREGVAPEGRAEDDSGERRGVGLGLSLVRQIARRHGGEVTCLAHEGGGACFEVSLPVGETRYSGAKVLAG